MGQINIRKKMIFLRNLETHFETENSAFLKIQKVNAITQVSQGILSTIVGKSLALQCYAVVFPSKIA